MKLWNYLVLFTTMALVLEFMGIPTALRVMLGFFNVEIATETASLVGADLESSSFYAQIFGTTGALLVVSAVSSIIIGFFARSYDPSLVVLPLIVFIGGMYASTAWILILYVMQTYNEQWLTNLVATIFIPLGVGFLWSCVDYFRGVD